LLLEGDAYAVYEELPTDVKKNKELLEDALCDAFSIGCFKAYNELRERRWTVGESVDVYLADLRQLAKLAKFKDEQIVKCAFVMGLPAVVAKTLVSSGKTHQISLAELVVQAKALVPDVQELALVVKSGNRENPKRRTDFTCYNSGERGHYSKDCQHPKKSNDEIVCYKCGQSGHIAKVCDSKKHLRDVACANSFQDSLKALPTTIVTVADRNVTAWRQWLLHDNCLTCFIQSDWSG